MQNMQLHSASHQRDDDAAVRWHFAVQKHLKIDRQKREWCGQARRRNGAAAACRGCKQALQRTGKGLGSRVRVKN